MWTKIKQNPQAVICVLAVFAVTFLLKVPAVKASQYHDALEWTQSGLATIAVLFIKALFGDNAPAVEKALSVSAVEKAQSDK